MAHGSGKKEEDAFDINAKSAKETTIDKASTRVDLKNKGVGPIKEVVLSPEVDQELAATGKALYQEYCTICHKPNEVFIGPAPKGILERRTPEWIMNMILNRTDAS